MKYLDLLGHKVTDCVTGFTGVVECVCYDLYGCIQLAVRAPVDEKGKTEPAIWLDAKRLTKVSDQPVMAQPSFEQAVEEPGPAEKPARR